MDLPHPTDINQVCYLSCSFLSEYSQRVKESFGIYGEITFLTISVLQIRLVMPFCIF